MFNSYLFRLSVYNYSKKKIKMDYSVIPITIDPKTLKAKSEVSNEEIDISDFKPGYKDSLNVRCFKKNKVYNVNVIEIVSDIEHEEKAAMKECFETFYKAFPFKFKYKKFLKSREYLFK